MNLEEFEVLHIEHERGYMNLYVKKFFPCDIQTSKKIFPLINKYVSENDIRMLKELFKKEISLKKEIIKQYETGTNTKRMLKKDFNEAKKLHNRYVRNLEMLIGKGGKVI